MKEEVRNVKSLSRLIILIVVLMASVMSAAAAGPSPYSVGWKTHTIATGQVQIGVKRVGSVLFGLGLLSARPPARAPQLAMWRSADGITWTPVYLSPSVFPAGASISAIVQGGPGYVAVGGKMFLQGAEQQQAMVWLSPDGRTWTRVSHQAAFDGAAMSAAAAGGPGLVAVGSIATNGRVPVSQERGVVWTSADGRTWRRLAGSVFAGANIVDVIKAGPGLVAVGDSYPAPPPSGSHAVVWVSSDGITWRRVQRDPHVFVNGSAMLRVVAGAHGLVASGITEPPNPDYHSLLWTSSDGLTWRLVPGDPLQHGLVQNLTTGGPGYMAVGQQDQDPVLWSSADGSTWRREVDGEVFTGVRTQLSSVTAMGGRIVVVGSRANSPSSNPIPTAWVWSPGSTARPPAAPRAPLDAKSFRLHFADLPSGYTSGMSSWLLICDLENRPDPAGRCHRMLSILGHYSAYISQFDRIDGSGEITGVSIVVPGAARARQVVQNPDVIIQPLEARSARRLSTSARIGQEFRLYGVRMLKHVVRQGESPYRDGLAGIWRDGRIIGIVKVTGTGNQAENLVVRLSQAMHGHLSK